MKAPSTRVPRRPVHGVLLLDKPAGMTSNSALQKAKWLLRAEKAGHTGTLDPMATGVLPLCFGAATKFSQLQLDADKSYVALARLGQRTTTGDAEGEVIEERAVDVTPERLQEAALRFTGAQRQVPPMHSALKQDGKPLYELARAGIEVPREPRSVQIYELKSALQRASAGFLAMELIVRCSKGTYIRTLAEDIGEVLGCGAHLVALRRTATGGFGLDRCVALDALEAMDESQRLAALMPVEALLDGHERLALVETEAGRFLSGLRRRGEWADAERVAVFGPESVRAPFLGTAHVAAGELIPDRLLNPAEIEQILEQT